jgi:hypothetical protein
MERRNEHVTNVSPNKGRVDNRILMVDAKRSIRLGIRQTLRLSFGKVPQKIKF